MTVLVTKTIVPWAWVESMAPAKRSACARNRSGFIVTCFRRSWHRVEGSPTGRCRAQVENAPTSRLKTTARRLPGSFQCFLRPEKPCVKLASWRIKSHHRCLRRRRPLSRPYLSPPRHRAEGAEDGWSCRWCCWESSA